MARDPRDDMVMRVERRRRTVSPELQAHRECIRDMLKGIKAPKELSTGEKQRWIQERLGNASRVCKIRREEDGNPTHRAPLPPPMLDRER